MKQGIRCSYWGKPADTSPMYFIDKGKRLGFDIVELEAGMLMARDAAQLRELRQYALDREISLTVGGGSLRSLSLCDRVPEVRDAGIVWRSRLMEKMEQADIQIFCGPMHAYWPYDFSETVHKAEERARSVGSMQRLSKIAENHGVFLCVEAVNRFENPILNTAAEGVAFCRDVGSRHARLLLDTFHMNIEEDNIPAAIRLAGPYLGHLHTGESNRKVPGKGSLPWREICEALLDIGYEGAAVMEPIVRNDGESAQSFRVWRMLAEGGEEKMDQDAAEAVRFLRTVYNNAKEAGRSAIQ